MEYVYHENTAWRIEDKSKTQLLQRTLLDTYDEGKEEWIVMKAVYLWSSRFQEVIMIPKWFVTDLASIPKPIRLLIAINQEHRYAAIIHDWLYRNGTERGRRMADLVFKDVCKLFKVPYWKTILLYLGVRVGGWTAYMKSERPLFVPVEHRLKYAREHAELQVGGY